MAQHRLAPPPEAEESEPTGTGRRKFLGYLLAAPTLVVAAQLGRSAFSAGSSEASALAVPSGPQLPEVYDLLDFLRDYARPTANLITVKVNKDGTVSMALPRSDNGQGIITSTQMIIAEELDLEVDQVTVTMADARPELVGNQITAGSSTTFTTYTPIRVAAAIAKGRLLQAASALLQTNADLLTSRGGMVSGIGGSSVPFSELAERAASSTIRQVETTLKPKENFRILGRPQSKTDQREIVTGQKKFATDLDIPDALPTVICRAPDLNGTPGSVANLDQVRTLPGVTDVEVVPTGVAVRAETYGQCIDAVRALTVEWEAGTVAGEDDESVLAKVRKAELPLAVPDAGGVTLEADFAFYFRSNSCLETNSAIADVRSDRAEIWGALKNPIITQSDIAKELDLPVAKVKVHVVNGGGSFGRKLFYDAALEAAQVSKAMGKPVRLMWTRADDSRQGRTHPLCTSRVRASYTKDAVLSYEQRHTSVATEINPGIGDAISTAATRAPGLGNVALSIGTFELTQIVPYNFGAVTRLLNEVEMGFNTTSMRNIYSPDLATARELVTDMLAEKMDKDPLEFRGEFLKSDRARKVLDKVAEEGDWGKSMAEGTAQGLGFHSEYKGVAACLVEIDCRPETVNRPAPQSDPNPLNAKETVTGPRITKVTYAVDVGLPLNPRTIEAQMQGGIMDAIAQTLTSSLHLRDGHFAEASWDNYYYTREWNVPPEINIIVMPATSENPGGVGEFGVAATCGAIACAYRRATGKTPEYFPINHKDPLPFEEKPLVPPAPASPVDGLKYTY